MRVAILGLMMALALTAPALAANPLDVVINEVAWGGTEASGTDEWLELLNNTSSPIDLTGWKIIDDVTTTYNLSGTIPANGYFLVEKTETVVNDIPADVLASSISFANTGDDLVLQDASGNTIDQALCNNVGWYAGSATTGSKATMERRNPQLPGNNSANWGANDGVTINGHDSGGGAIRGTPRAQNSVYSNQVFGPEIVHVMSAGNDAVDVWFGTALEAASAQTAANYTLNAGSDVHPTTATLDGTDNTLVHLTGITGIAAQSLTTLTAVGVKDLAGQPSNTSIQLYFGIVPMLWARTDGNGNFVPDILDNTPNAIFTVQGIVSAANTFTSGEVAIQDATSGIFIFAAGQTSSMQLGDELRVAGKPLQYNGKFEITSIKYVRIAQNQPVVPEIHTVADILANAEVLEGVLVGITNVSPTTTPSTPDTWPIATRNANIEISDDAGTSKILMRIDADTNIDGSPEPTWPIGLVGVVAQFSTDTPPNNGYQVFPRSLNDINGLCGTAGQTRPCYDGPVGTDQHLPCKPGTQTCDGTAWGPCDGQVLPGPADTHCDGVDDNCDGATDDGANTQTDPLNCGACGTVCNLPHVTTQTCQGGQCVIASGACEASWYDCNTTATDGCEAQLGTDTNCASCGDDCTTQFPHAAGTCQNNACVMGACDAGWDDCNAQQPGCETNVRGDRNNCGSCNHVCDPGYLCVNGLCDNTCQDGDGDLFADHTCGGTDCDDSDPLTYPGAAEICDGVDNDCDTPPVIDEGFPVGQACDGDDTDLCTNGVNVCKADHTGVECQETVHKEEICNSQDDDCDTLIDEDWPDKGKECDGSDEDSCAEGHFVCNGAGNGIVCDESPTGGKQELCNNIDDDCDGSTDEDFAGNYTCGVGECRNEVEKCKQGVPQQCVPKQPPEARELTCNDNLDNDCDGFTDKQDPDCGSGGGGGCGCSFGGGPASLASLGLLLGALAGLRRRRSA